MKVILLADIKGVGKKDEIIEVSDGYAKNFLFPQKKGIVADNTNLTKLKGKQDKIIHDRKVEYEAATELKAKIEQIELKIEAKSGENGRLFGTITGSEISKELEEKFGIKIDRKKIIVDTPIKSTGGHEVKIKLDQGVIAKLDIEIK